MFKEKFGFFPKKTVQFDGDTLKIGNYEVKKEELFCVYFRPFNFLKNEWGTVYFSLNGEDYNSSTDIFAKNVFKFTKNQTESALNLIKLMEIEVIEKENDLGLMPTTKKKSLVNVISCPNCKSTNIDFMQNNKKNFSVGKAAAGAALTGGVGTLAGFAGKKGNNQWHCKQCGNLFETKPK